MTTKKVKNPGKDSVNAVPKEDTWVDDTKQVVAVNHPGDVKEGDGITLDMDTRVIIHGKPVPPVATDLTVRNGEVVFENRTVRAPNIPSGFREFQVNAYRFELNGRDIVAFLDKDSFLENTEEPNRYPWDTDYKRFNAGDHAVIMVNAISTNDNFIGVSLLQNVESINNLLNATSLRALTTTQGRRRDFYSWSPEYGDDKESKITAFNSGCKRHVHRDCQFKRSSVTDSKLLPGLYRRSNITNVDFGSARRVIVEDASLDNCEIAGSDIRLEQMMLNRCILSCEGSIFVRNLRLTRKNFYNTGLYLVNKFCFTALPVVSRNDLNLVRISETELEFGSGRNNVIRIKLADVDSYALREQVAKLLEENDRYTSLDRVGFNAIADSIMSYVMDSLRSRMRMITLIDAAAGAANVLEINLRPDLYDNIYEV